MRDVELDDLVALAVPIATDELNDLLGGVPYADIELSPTEFFGPRASCSARWWCAISRRCMPD